MAQAATSSSHATPRFLERYTQEIAPALMKQFQLKNRLAVARLEKIVVNMGCGEAAHEAKVLEEALRDLGLITGQRPMVTRAKKAGSNFKIKEGDAVGCTVTLRRHRMYEFLERLICVALPRIRDFRGVSKRGFDEGGNYSFGIRDQSIFAELRLDEVHYTLGMDVTIVTTAESPEQVQALLEAFGMPFEKPERS